MTSYSNSKNLQRPLERTTWEHSNSTNAPFWDLTEPGEIRFVVVDFLVGSLLGVGQVLSRSLPFLVVGAPPIAAPGTAAAPVVVPFVVMLVLGVLVIDDFLRLFLVLQVQVESGRVQDQTGESHQEEFHLEGCRQNFEEQRNLNFQEDTDDD